MSEWWGGFITCLIIAYVIEAINFVLFIIWHINNIDWSEDE